MQCSWFKCMYVCTLQCTFISITFGYRSDAFNWTVIVKWSFISLLFQTKLWIPSRWEQEHHKRCLARWSSFWISNCWHHSSTYWYHNPGRVDHEIFWNILEQKGWPIIMTQLQFVRIRYHVAKFQPELRDLSGTCKFRWCLPQ